jgi:hypothetical protein
MTPMRKLALIVLVLAGLVAGSAGAATTGDIPDNQVFITYKGASYTLKVPEGWTRSGSGSTVTFRDKDNSIRIVVEAKHHPAGKITFRTKGVPNSVTGKRVTLVVDRYYKPKGAKTAVIDLAGPVGVDNVDAFKFVADSFRWR